MATVYPGYGAGPTSNITIATHGAGTNNTISITGAGTGYNTSVLSATGIQVGPTWTNSKTTAQGQLHLEGENADLVMNGVSLKEILNGITDRLSILQPKPELLEKYENLREAYEHYKTLEKLLSDYSDE